MVTNLWFKEPCVESLWPCVEELSPRFQNSILTSYALKHPIGFPLPDSSAIPHPVFIASEVFPGSSLYGLFKMGRSGQTILCHSWLHRHCFIVSIKEFPETITS